MSRAWAWLLAGLTAVAVLVGLWIVVWRDTGSRWTVEATVADPRPAVTGACIERPGVAEVSFLGSFDAPVDPRAPNLFVTVRGRDRADEVAACLRGLQATDVTVGPHEPR